MPGTVPLDAQLYSLVEMIAGFLSACQMALFSSNITISSSTTLANMLAGEASFTGYARSNLTTWSTPTNDGTNAAVSTTTQGQFTATGSGGTGNLYGYFLVNSAGTQWYGGERFSSAPITQPQNLTFEIDETYSAITRF